MQYREYDPSRDREAVHRIWREVGWLGKDKTKIMDTILESCRAVVAEVNGEAECLVNSAAGVLRYLDTDLPFAGCNGAATSRVARRQGLAKRALARLVAADVADGALVVGLGMFDQGFYDQLGYGTGGYEHTLRFDPAALRVSVRARPPRRLSAEDRDLMHASRLARLRAHGGVNFHSPVLSETRWGETYFGLGYCDGPDGALTHHFWCNPHSVESGPYKIEWMAYQSREQFLELMAVIKSLGDQIVMVEMREPPLLQLQDLIARPFRQQRTTERSQFQTRIAALAYWQMRICDLPKCLAHTRLPGVDLRFNLRLSDPIERLLDEEAPWRGVAGEYVVTLGESSGAEPGRDPDLSTLNASVNAFTRLWLGARTASGLAMTGQLSGVRSLLEKLDSALRLPEPRPDWDF